MREGRAGNEDLSGERPVWVIVVLAVDSSQLLCKW